MLLRDLLARPEPGLQLLHAGDPEAPDRSVYRVYTTELIDPLSATGRTVAAGPSPLTGSELDAVVAAFLTAERLPAAVPARIGRWWPSARRPSSG